MIYKDLKTYMVATGTAADQFSNSKRTAFDRRYYVTKLLLGPGSRSLTISSLMPSKDSLLLWLCASLSFSLFLFLPLPSRTLTGQFYSNGGRP